MNFASPAFLIGLLAISIPIIIHLIELRRARKILFTNVAFIKEVKNITSSHRRIKQILILLSRIGFIIFLVFCFAQPFIPQTSQAITTKNVKIYIDNSFSLQNESIESGKKLLELGVNHAKKLVSNLDPNTKFNFIDNSNKSNIFSDFTFSKFLEQLEQIKFSSAYKKTEIIISGLNGSINGSSDSFYYSDFQKDSFNSNTLQEINDNHNLYLIHLKGEAKSNAFIDSIYLEDEFTRVNHSNNLKVRIRNSGRQDIEKCQLKFFTGQQLISAININLPATQSRMVSLNYRLSDKLTQQCKITLQDSPIEFDNDYYFTLKAAESISITEVGENGNSSINRLYTNEPLFKFQFVKPQQFSYTLLNQTNLIILNGLTNITESFADNLRDYALKGGNIIFIPGAESAPSVNTAFFNKMGINSIKPVSTAGNNVLHYELALPETKNPFFKNIFERSVNKIVMPKAARVLSWQQSSSDILKFKTGFKFLSSFNKGRGKVYVYASPLNEEFSDFASHAFFVPVFYKLALQSFTQKQQLAYTLGNTTIQYPALNSKANEVYKLVKDSISFIPDQKLRNGIVSIKIPEEIIEAGFYDLQKDNKKVTEFAFNYPRRESDLRAYSIDDLKAMVGDAKNIKVLDGTDEVSVKKLYSDSNLGIQLWKYCLILCLVFILTEILLIRFM